MYLQQKVLSENFFPAIVTLTFTDFRLYFFDACLVQICLVVFLLDLEPWVPLEQLKH